MMTKNLNNIKQLNKLNHNKIKQNGKKTIGTDSSKDREKVYSGDIVFIQPKYMMTHDNTMAVMKKFQQLGIKKCITQGNLSSL